MRSRQRKIQVTSDPRVVYSVERVFTVRLVHFRIPLFSLYLRE